MESAEKTSQLDRYFIIFGVGSRTCIGKNISLMEIQETIPALVRLFEFEAVSARPWETNDSWFVKQLHYNCRIKLRAG